MVQPYLDRLDAEGETGLVYVDGAYSHAFGKGALLAGGMPAVTALPLDAVGSMIGELVSGMGAQTLQYGSGQGDPRLRERICDVMALEGITDASPNEVVVTVGSQQGLDLVTRVFCDPGDVILAEGPSYVGALEIGRASCRERV